ncbi:MAG: putative Flagellin, Flp1-like, domain [Clostridiales bacterium]|jgi:competence protein ComGC|nr:putative Flagellin, Flp1-like, domain [Clostridiales bacterium]
MKKFKKKLTQNNGMGMIEIIIIILILLAIAIIFRQQISNIVTEVLQKVKTDLLGF